MSSRIRVLITALLCAAPAATCAPPAREVAAEIGEPLPGLTEAELARFRAGERLFDRVFRPEEGVGPLFNENQCSACHTSPVTGGTGDQLVVRASRFSPPASCDALTTEGGENVRTQATPLLRAHGIDRQTFPAAATERGSFTVTFLFGLGLVELIPDAEILRRADPDDRDRDGISGRVGRDAYGRVGRFGRKAELATLADFTDSALRFEMGLTTPRHPAEPEPAAQPYPDGVDPAPDPEIGDASIALLVDFVRFLAPPARRPPQDAYDRQTIARGAQLFRDVGCASCHVPSMTTSRSSVAALSRRQVALYSDLLLHDLGDGMRNVCGIAATPNELRTAPLMGLRHRRALLHDGRANGPLEAIEAHGGEAFAVRSAVRALPELDRHALLTFLGTL